MRTKIHRRCACGCGLITNPGKRWVHGHVWKDKHRSEETRKKMSLSAMGNTRMRGYKHSEEAKQKISLSQIKCNPDYEYCDEWKDREYRKDLRKDYCENEKCKGNYKRLVNHHIDLNKRHCHPSNVMTLCISCSSTLHRTLELGHKKEVNHKDYLTIIRKDHITYIHKKTRRRVTIGRR